MLQPEVGRSVMPFSPLSFPTSSRSGMRCISPGAGAMLPLHWRKKLDRPQLKMPVPDLAKISLGSSCVSSNKRAQEKKLFLRGCTACCQDPSPKVAVTARHAAIGQPTRRASGSMAPTGIRRVFLFWASPTKSRHLSAYIIKLTRA